MKMWFCCYTLYWKPQLRRKEISFLKHRNGCKLKWSETRLGVRRRWPCLDLIIWSETPRHNNIFHLADSLPATVSHVQHLLPGGCPMFFSFFVVFFFFLTAFPGEVCVFYCLSCLSCSLLNTHTHNTRCSLSMPQRKKCIMTSEPTTTKWKADLSCWEEPHFPIQPVKFQYWRSQAPRTHTQDKTSVLLHDRRPQHSFHHFNILRLDVVCFDFTVCLLLNTD